jgi:hypothetical protein
MELGGGRNRYRKFVVCRRVTNAMVEAAGVVLFSPIENT